MTRALPTPPTPNAHLVPALLAATLDLPELNNRISWAKTFEYVFTDEMRTDTPQFLPIPEWIGGSSGVEPEPFYLLNQDYLYYANL
jgi:phospholipase C